MEEAASDEKQTSKAFVSLGNFAVDDEKNTFQLIFERLVWKLSSLRGIYDEFHASKRRSAFV